ncbi:hypothetical protein PR202_ga04057 [Eleusine coracana subsp. coracana]|uniref:DNA-directed RNA polymerase n=1 Tax=Eleusine coracana subsp. coracana TaxID=191504 RepID=A0AAV5BQP0_ELECO|nr:hypothetical protein PR202_ga04057 [Eleusine coracana subsp. coracana]
MEGFEKDDYETVAKAVLKDYVFVHLKYNHDKFNLLIFMLQKLYALVDKTAAPDNADALQYQEALLPGHLITVFLKDRLQDWLRKTKRLILEEAAKNKSFDLHDGFVVGVVIPLDICVIILCCLCVAHEIRKFLGKNTTSVGRAIESMLKVGKVNSQSGLDLPQILLNFQRDGMTIQAERLNFHRYISHFRAVHRGAAFAKMRTTSVRKLLPEYGSFMPFYFLFLCLHPLIPEDLEVGYVPLSLGGAYPGLYLFTNPARFVRPVRNLISLPDGKENIELIGPFEQMAKQTMGFCGQALKFRTDVKAFHLQDRLQDWLRKTKRLILEEAAKNKSFDLHDAHEIRKFLGKNTTSVGRAIESMLKVGKVNSQSGLDLPQRDGMTIQAERLNFHRYISHFRAVHRGAAFAKMRTTSIPEDLEVGYVPLSLGGAYPGLYLFTNPARFVRPVRNLISLPDGKENIELIGPFEQAFMEIKCPDGGAGGRNILFPATHEEIHPTAILSVVANLTPWSDHNQSPRNMYQCQMAKQTMGFCGQALKFRTDVKAFHLQVSSYDMEDAMILNKSAVDRGMFRGHIYQASYPLSIITINDIIL